MCATFLRDVAATLGEGDAFLLGVDLVKETSRLVAAYDDAAGVTREFNLNVLRVLNRELRADFDVDAFEHVARCDPEQEWMEISVRSLRGQTVQLRTLGLAIDFELGELMRTEISTKFHREGIESELREAGFLIDRSWTDDAGDFALLLASHSG
jgi:L-histidine N-alpha-methyltransferase